MAAIDAALNLYRKLDPGDQKTICNFMKIKARQHPVRIPADRTATDRLVLLKGGMDPGVTDYS